MRRKKSCGNAEAGRDSGCRTALWTAASFFSGGMRQRCVLAIALACDPEILFADEATTALDATVEAKILDLLLELREKTGISIVFISHDLGAVARIADRVAVMYAGKIIEIGTAEDVYYDPRHPYTWGLLSSLPVFAGEKGELNPIPGMPPSLLDPPPGDAFAVRNPQHWQSIMNRLLRCLRSVIRIMQPHGFWMKELRK